MNPIVLVLVVPLVLENAETGWDVEDENENDDEDETPVHGERERAETARTQLACPGKVNSMTW